MKINGNSLQDPSGTMDSRIPPPFPTLAAARERIEMDIRKATNKLDRMRLDCCVLAEAAEPIERELARLMAETPEQRLALLMMEYEKADAEYQAYLRQLAWLRFIERRGRRYDPCRLGTYEINHEAQKTVVDAVRHYAANITDNVRGGVNLVLHGPCGTGKDHLLAALIHVAIQSHGIRVEWMSGIKIAAKAEEKIEVDWGQLGCREWPHVLAISDPCPPSGLDNAGGYRTRQTADLLHMLIDRCYSDGRPIWVTLNASDRGQAVEQLGAQIVDRLTDNAVVLACNWPSYRQPRRAAG